MLDGRIYRAGLLPLLLVLAVAGFSLGARSGPLSSTLAPDAFDGARAYADLKALAALYPDRRPGSPGDEALARYVARAFATAGPAGGGFQVSVRRFSAQTIDGERTLTDVIAARPGSTDESAIAILAHRDAALPGSAAELSGTAALLELAHVFAHSETRRTIVLVSTSGGSGGDAGAVQLAAGPHRPLDAAVALGDLAGAQARRPFVSGFSSGAALAPEALTRTFDYAISQQVGTAAGDPAFGEQLTRLSLPIALGEQGPLDAAGIPAVLVQASGERGPYSDEAVSSARLSSFGSAVLSGIYALDEGPDISPAIGPRLGVAHKLLAGWVVRVVALALLLAPLLAGVDALARLRRRREPLGRGLLWVAGWACPPLAAALAAIALGRLGIVAAPRGQPSAQALASISSAPVALAVCALVLVLALGGWPTLVRRSSLPLRPPADAAGVALVLMLLGACTLEWLLNPFACLLLVPALHVCLLACTPQGRRPAVGIAIALASLAAPALLLGAYAHELGLGPVGLAESVVQALAGGQVGLLAALAWSVALGCVGAALLLSLPLGGGDQLGPGTGPAEPARILTRGPLSYAGPGSLGGTESALRR
jgi:peptidase M28-like protein